MPESIAADGVSSEPVRNALRVSALLGIAWMFLYGAIGTGLVGPNRASVEREFGWSHAAFGAGYAVLQVGCALTVLGLTLRLRRFDRSRALVGSLFLQTAGFLVVFLSRAPLGLIAGWTLITGGAVLGFVSNSLSAGLWPENPRRGVLLLHGCDGAGKVSGPLLAAVCLGWGWRWSFLAAGGMTLGLGLFALLRLRGIPTSPSPPQETGTGESVPAYKLFRLCIVPFGLMTGANVSFAALVPTYGHFVLGLGASASSLLLSVHLGGMAMGRFVFLGWNRRGSPDSVIRLCLAMGLFVFLLAPGFPLPLVGIALFGVGGMFSGIWPTYYARISPAFRDAPHRLDYGGALGGNLGSALAVFASSLIAERSLYASLVFGPVLMAIFGIGYFSGLFSPPSPPSE